MNSERSSIGKLGLSCLFLSIARDTFFALACRLSSPWSFLGTARSTFHWLQIVALLKFVVSTVDDRIGLRVLNQRELIKSIWSVPP